MNKYNDYKIPIEIPDLQFFDSDVPFPLESGAVLPRLRVAFHTYGTLNEEKNNVIWVCHALTANSHVADWWSGIFGAGKILDPEKYFIVCANILGSCYGTTCPRSINPETGEPFGMSFPLITMRDMVQAHELLRKYLKINSIDLCIGGSCGGHQVMEFAYLLKEKIKRIALLVTSARETAWAIAIHEAQRLAIETDHTFTDNTDKAGKKGLTAARGMALLGYRTFRAYVENQTEADEEKLNHYRATSYIQYQGQKLERRFYAHCYWFLIKALDTHNMGRGRGGAAAALAELQMPAFVLSIDSDLLIPPSEQQFMAAHLPKSTYFPLDSPFGHDGFLIETDRINRLLLQWKKSDG